MYDPKFEKGVRQKMEGLEFAPPESVWANIEKAVAGRRRRPAFYFWRFALPGMVLAGAVAVVFLTGSPSKVDTATAKRPSLLPPAGKDHPMTPEATAGPHAAASAQPAPALFSNPPRMDSTTRSFFATAHVINGIKKPKATTATDITNNNQTDAIDQTFTLNANATSTSIAPYLYQPPLAGQGSAAAIKATRLATKTTAVTLNRLEKKNRPWEAGFVAGGGISRLNRVKVNTGGSALSTSLYNVVSAAYAAPSKQYVSDVRPDAAFEGGIYVQKALSDRWTFNVGMNLHYYSTRITIGEPVNTYVPVSASLVQPTVAPPSQTTASYIAGDRVVFTNHYYFLELPAHMQYTLKKSRMLPVFLQGGFSLSRLVGADALFYNAHSGVYYKDPNVLQKTQVNFSSALMVGLPFHGIRIQMGPEVQYGLTPLINTSNQGDQHFLYTGFRVVVIPGKK